MSSVTIRKPVLNDAPFIVECRRAAILGKGPSHYPKEMLQEWAAEWKPENLQRVHDGISEQNWIYIIAEAESQIIGFGIVHPKKNMLGAVYVRPNEYGKIGGIILSELYRLAQASGCTYLEMESSANAEKFYLDNGFKVISRGVHKMKSGHEMDCVNMRIDF